MTTTTYSHQGDDEPQEFSDTEMSLDLEHARAELKTRGLASAQAITVFGLIATVALCSGLPVYALLVLTCTQLASSVWLGTLALMLARRRG